MTLPNISMPSTELRMNNLVNPIGQGNGIIQLPRYNFQNYNNNNMILENIDLY